MSTTLDQLIHDAAGASQDLTLATAESNAGDLKTFTSSLDLLEEDDYFRGCEAYFTSGLNAGLSRRVYSSDYETATITLATNLPNAVLAGDTVELYNHRSGGLLRKEYKDRINRAIREASETAGDPVSVLLNGVYGGTQEIPVPSGIASVCQVQWYDDVLLQWSTIKRATRYGQRGWYPLRESQSIELSYDWQTMANGYQLRFRGYLLPVTLNAGTDTTNVDPEWIVETVTGMAQMSNPDNYNNLAPGQYARNRGDQIRGKMANVPIPNCARIR